MLRLITAVALAFLASSAIAQQVRFTAITTPFNSPIGIDHHVPTNTLIMSVNYASGLPHNLERINPDGSHVQFSSLAGLGDELKIATVKIAAGGFTVGDVFCGNGNDGEIVRVSANGSVIQNPWVSLPGAGNGLLRGSLFHDASGVFGGDLLAVTTGGQAWRVDASGNATLLASVATHLEGLLVVPADPTRYGPLAGKLIAGAENQGLMYAVDPAGTVQSFALGVNIEDIDLIPAGQSFFGVNFGTGVLLGAPASAFAGMAGDILLTQEGPNGNAGIFRLRWDGASLVVTPFTAASNSAPVGQWEHVTFAPVGVVPFPTCTVTPTPPFAVAAGMPLQFQVVGADVDLLDTVTLTAIGRPAAASISPPLPATGNPTSVTFSWTPALADVGNHLVQFTATDSGGLATTCRVDIRVTCSTAAWTNYGAGWPGSGNVVPALTLGALPLLGSTPDVLVTNTRGQPSFACILWGPGPAQMPTAYGGSILTQQGLEFSLPLGTGVNPFPLAIPASASLCGYEAWLQVVLYDEGASQFVAFTRGMHMMLGL